MLELCLGLHDLWTAYKRVPSQENSFCAIAIFSVEHQDLRYFVRFGHNLWLQSVFKFNHVSEAMSVFARVFGASCCDHFCDDFMDA